MTLYRYEAAAASGELVTGEMEALNQDIVVERLHALGYVPIRADTAASGMLSRLLAQSLTLRRARKPGNLVFLTQQLAMLLQAGLSLDRALEIAQTVIEGKAEQRLPCAPCSTRCAAAARSPTRWRRRTASFRPFISAWCAPARPSGSLDATLRHLAELLERSQAAREQVKSALIYPSLVLATGAGSIAILFGFVIPRFRPLFEEAGTALPFATQMVLALSDLFSNYGWLIAAAIVVAVLLLRYYINTPEGRRRWDRRLLAPAADRRSHHQDRGRALQPHARHLAAQRRLAAHGALDHARHGFERGVARSHVDGR